MSDPDTGQVRRKERLAGVSRVGWKAHFFQRERQDWVLSGLILKLCLARIFSMMIMGWEMKLAALQSADKYGKENAMENWP